MGMDIRVEHNEGGRMPMTTSDKYFLLAIDVAVGAVLLAPLWTMLAWPWLNTY